LKKDKWFGARVMANDLIRDFKLSDKEYKAFVDLVYAESGINLGDNKQHLVKTRLQKIMRNLNIKTFKEYYNYIVKSNENRHLIEFIDAITTNHTNFFREQDHFSYLANFVIPEIILRKKLSGENRIRAWCCAASSGEEPYTVMMCLLEKISNFQAFDFKFLCSDISPKVLSAAVKGIYSKEKVKDVPNAFLNRYFEKVPKKGEPLYQVKSMLKEYLRFRIFNLMSAQFPFKGKFDFVFCRNVMIYFDSPTREALLEKILNYLVPKGYLFIGHSENITMNVKNRLKIVAPAIYEKVF